MNKTQLVDALTERLGDRRTAATAVDGLIEIIVDAVRGGGSVTLTGFGVFESRARAARVARNPRTGETVEVAATTVPAFRPGAGFRTAVGGGGAPAPRATPARRPRATSTTTAATTAASKTAAPRVAVAEAPAATPARSGKAKADTAFAAVKPAKAEKVDKSPKPAKAGKTGKADDKPKKGKGKK